MDRQHKQAAPAADLGVQLQQEPAAVSSTDTLLAAVKAGPPPERAWLVDEMARRDRQTADALRDALEERNGSPWLQHEIDERAARQV